MEGRRVPYMMGEDTVIEEEISCFGLHRRHLMHRHGMPDAGAQMQGIPKNAISVRGWTWIDEKDTGHLVLAWKEQA